MKSEGLDGSKGSWGYFFLLIIYLFIHLFIYLFIYFFNLFIYLAIYLFIYLSIFFLFFYLSSSLPVYLYHSVKKCNVELCSIQFIVVKYSEVWYIVILQSDIWTSKNGLISLIIILFFDIRTS